MDKTVCPFCWGAGWHDWRCRVGQDCYDCDGTGTVAVPADGRWQSSTDPGYSREWRDGEWRYPAD